VEVIVPEQEARSELLVCLVLYRQKLLESVAFHSLVSQAPGLGVRLFLWDNSPEQHSVEPCTYETNMSVFLSVERHSDRSNPGLAKAYNAAWKFAHSCGIEWIITLDQDTRLPNNYLNQLTQELGPLTDSDVVLTVPKVAEQGRFFSPVRVRFGLPWPPSFVLKPGIYGEGITTINSGACVNVRFLQTVGGYNEDFPLDYLDHWLCRTVYQAGKKIALFDSVIEHQLSLHDFNSKVSVERYRNILESQNRFVLTSTTGVPRFALLLMMIPHIVFKLITCPDKRFFRIAIGRWLALAAGRIQPCASVENK
jgi:GT2 family glycosyltransferase